MNVILRLPYPLAQFTTMYIMEILKLPEPVFCNTMTELIDVSRTLKTKTIITQLDLYTNEIKAFYDSGACDGYARIIVLPTKPYFPVEELLDDKIPSSSKICDTGNLYAAIQYCHDTERYLLSVCLVGITYEEFFNNPAMATNKDRNPMLGVNRIEWPQEIVYGRLYLIIDKKHNQHHRRIYASDKENHLRLEVDCKLTPSQCKGNPPASYIAVNEILGILEITMETISFM